MTEEETKQPVPVQQAPLSENRGDFISRNFHLTDCFFFTASPKLWAPSGRALLGGPPVCTLALELAASTSSIPCPVPPEGDLAFQALF
ncbi:hypothetical protein AVEN_179572-1 [Araneus ventricosus]|uniref:Uncharacterized protein n=1 Tax=Araneus ventricosus TaxID=182803 RepID=A0A4Y2BEQ7_ARAVE|nr:hypothetical protein AVEN_179572-1 [Araneus ventricosus]